MIQQQTGGIDWTQATVIAALIGGTFAIVKELITFGLERVRKGLDEAHEGRRTRARLAQFYFQTATGAWKSLASWQVVISELRYFDVLVNPEPPLLDFMIYEDEELTKHVLNLSHVSPEQVSTYIHILQVQKSLRESAAQELEQFKSASATYSYPRTRRYLGILLEQCVEALERVTEGLRDDIWNDDGGAKERYRRAAKNMKEQRSTLSVPTAQEVREEQLRVVKEQRRDPPAATAGSSTD